MQKWWYQSFVFVLWVVFKPVQARISLEHFENFQGVCSVAACESSKDDYALTKECIARQSIRDAQLPEAEEDFVFFEKNSLCQNLSDEKIRRAIIFSHLAYKSNVKNACKSLNF